MPARAQASSLSDTSPETPTAPITAPPASLTSTPPGTGTTRPSDMALRAPKKGTSWGCSAIRRASARVPTPIPSAPHALAIAIWGLTIPAPSSRANALRWPPASRTATANGAQLVARAFRSADSTMVVACCRLSPVISGHLLENGAPKIVCRHLAEGHRTRKTTSAMAEIVAALMTSHAPLMTGRPEVSKPEQRDRLYGGFHELRRRLTAARPDLIVVFVNDHIQNFPYSNMPAFCVGLAEAYDAPSPGGGRFMRIPPRKVRGAPAWGMALLERGLAAGVDFAYSYEIEGWDELSVPLHFLTPEGNVPIAPVYTTSACWITSCAPTSTHSSVSPTTRSSATAGTAVRRSATGSRCSAPSPPGRARSSPTSRSWSGSPAARPCGCIRDPNLVRPQQAPDRRRPPARHEGRAHRR